MTEFWKAFKTETQIILIQRDRKFRSGPPDGNFVARDLAQRGGGQISRLALEARRESRHCPARFFGKRLATT
jgi:hypothetical protein